MSYNVLKSLRRMIVIGFLIICQPAQRVVGQAVTVAMVIDGDRLVLSSGQKVKLGGIDAPEKHASEKLTRDALASGKREEVVIRQGQLAADHLTNIAGGHPVLIQVISEPDLDGYLPALVYVTDHVGQPVYSLNQKMLIDGYAVAMVNQLEYRGFDRLEEQARLDKRGLWAESLLFVEPQRTESHDVDSAVLSGDCARDDACVWVTAGGGQQNIGLWKSRPGRKCMCAIN